MPIATTPNQLGSFSSIRFSLCLSVIIETHEWIRSFLYHFHRDLYGFPFERGGNINHPDLNFIQ